MPQIPGLKEEIQQALRVPMSLPIMHRGDILCSDSCTILAKQQSLSGLAFNFLIYKKNSCINILRSLWFLQFMIQWFALKRLKKEGTLAHELWVEFFFKIPFSFPLQCALLTCHWMSYNQSTKESSTFLIIQHLKKMRTISDFFSLGNM